MNDVSRVAGVSRGTVSNYINGRSVRPNTKLKIENAIKTLNYVPNATARALKTNRSNYVVWIIPTVNSPFFSELSYHMQIALDALGYKMILCNSNSQASKEMAYIEMAKTQKVAGIITMSYADISHLVSPDIPLVAIENRVTQNFPLIISDNYQGGFIAAEQLYQRGARRLLFISKTPVVGVSALREKGFKDFCQQNHIHYHRFIASDSVQFIDDFEQFINSNITYKSFNYDGIFSDSDEYASDFWHLLLQHHIAVPADVQIIGFDAAKIYARQQPMLSSIRQPIEKIVHIAVQQLQYQLSNPNTKASLVKPIILPVTFIEGMTTK